MADGTCWADVFAAATEDHASVGVYDCFLFAGAGLRFEGLCVAEFDAFAACGAFSVVYFRVPGNFIARNAFVFGFCHIFTATKVFITTFKYCYKLIEKP